MKQPMKPFPFYRQPDSMDCGPTCLQMIAKYYGKNVSLQYLRERSQIGKEGVNLLGISEAAESIGLRSHAVKITYPSLVDVPLPCILYWNQRHFVVLYKIKRVFYRFARKKVETLYISDPSHGPITFAKEEFLQRWTSNKNADSNNEGIALLLEPSQEFNAHNEEDAGSRKGDGQLAFKNIFNYLYSYKKLVFQLLLGLGVASILQLAVPFLTQSVIDVGVNTANIHFVYIVLLAQMALFAGRLITDFVRSWILLHISTRINISILTDFLIKLMKLPLSFFDSKRTGDILQRMNDHQRIESFLTGSSLSVLFASLNLFVFSVVLAVFNVYIFIVFIIATFLYSLWVVIFLRKRKVLDYRRFEIGSREQGAVIQFIQGMQEIKLNGIENSMRWKWERLQAKLFKLNMKGLALNQWQQSGASFINEGKNIFITFLSAKAVIDGQMTLGAMLAVQYIIGQLNSPIEQMIGFVQNWQNAKISMDRLNEIHSMENEEPAQKFLLSELSLAFARQTAGGKKGPEGFEAAKEVPLESSLFRRRNVLLGESLISEDRGDAIIFNNVSFTYSGAGNEPVLKNINLKIPLGKTTAIVGISGSGKTTLLKLLLKFYEPQGGEIRFGNLSLSNISHKAWRRHCGTVMQESFVFSDSIANNIAVDNENIDMDRLRHAVHVASIGDFIDSLPLGYNTKIGAEGNGISMGQKQRILIARAVYRNPEFIFFDEATNSLDANNERAIIDNLSVFFEGRTVIIVAHRLSTVKHADQIIVLNNGKVSERGTHQELLNIKGEYFTLVKNQLDLGE
jgi:ATP-binding cassette, subfamily B, bacterial